MPNTFFLLAGEASGDQHAARLIESLKQLAPTARFVGMGGPKMQAAGLEVAKNLDGMQVVGFWEVAKAYGFFKKVFYDLLDRLRQERPSALICIDYPGFNLRFAKEVRKLGIPVLYYIVPQVWAWKALRAKSMAQYVDRCFCVFPFEPPFFEKYGLKTEFVGHPLVDGTDGDRGPGAGGRGTELGGAKNPVDVPGTRTPEPGTRSLLLPKGAERVVGVFPGSRNGELEQHLGVLTKTVSELTVGGKRPIAWVNLPGSADRKWLREIDGREQRPDGFHRDLAAYWPEKESISALEKEGAGAMPCRLPSLSALADFNVVKSGTSTLEAGLAGNPMCVVYRGSPISYFIAHQLVNIPVFSLVNIVLGRYAVPELIQGDMNPARLTAEIRRGLEDAEYIGKQKEALAEIPKKLGGPGASLRAAQGILNFLRGR